MATDPRRVFMLSLVLAGLILTAGCSHGTENQQSPYTAHVEDADTLSDEGTVHGGEDEKNRSPSTMDIRPKSSAKPR